MPMPTKAMVSHCPARSRSARDAMNRLPITNATDVSPS